MMNEAVATETMFAELACGTCGSLQSVPWFRCPGAGDDRDHRIERRLNLVPGQFPDGSEPNPFIRFRRMLSTYGLARRAGLTDEEYCAVVRRLDGALIETEGIERPLTATPFGRSDALSEAFGFQPQGGLWLKQESDAAAGGIAMRGVFSTTLYLELAERVGHIAREEGVGKPLVLAGSGHAGFAGAAFARSTGHILDVLLPSGVPEERLAAIRSLGANVRIVPRTIGRTGDPRETMMHEALEKGALPYNLRPADNALAAEGEATCGYEMLSDLTALGHGVDRLIVHAGGDGMLGSIIDAFQQGGELGLLIPLPRIYSVQPTTCNPMFRAYDRLARRIVRRLEKATGQTAPEAVPERAAWIAQHAWSPIVREEMNYARSHRSAFMWRWEETVSTAAADIADADVGDWWKVCEGMLLTGGFPLAVEDSTLRQASALLMEQCGLGVDLAGAAGLAGLVALAGVDPPQSHERIALLT